MRALRDTIPFFDTHLLTSVNKEKDEETSLPNTRRFGSNPLP